MPIGPSREQLAPIGLKWKLRGAFFTPGDPQVIVPGTPRPPNNTPRARGDHFGSFREKSGKSAKSRPDPTQIAQFFTPFFTPWLDLMPARRSGSKKAARGCPRIQIWSHEGPNQSQNHGFAHPENRKARVASGLEPRHVLRKQAIFSFSSKHTHPGKMARQIDKK